MSVSLAGWRLVQIFLSPKVAVFEVEQNSEDQSLRCTCPNFLARASCSHVKYVLKEIEENGSYQTALWQRVDPSEAEAAAESLETWRKFIITNGKVLMV